MPTIGRPLGEKPHRVIKEKYFYGLPTYFLHIKLNKPGENEMDGEVVGRWMEWERDGEVEMIA